MASTSSILWLKDWNPKETDWFDELTHPTKWGPQLET